MKRYCPLMKSQVRDNAQDQASSPNPDAPMKIHFYALQSRSDQESSPNVVICMLELFSIHAYLLNPRSTLSF